MNDYASVKSPEERFSDRVANYVKYRPSYPLQVVETLSRQCGLNNESAIADIGSGTGIFTSLLMDAGFRVMAVEPNREMRLAAEERFAGNPLFLSNDGTAEHTGLNSCSVDLIVAAQAFHWFDRSACSSEFRRILKPGGMLALVWNQRKTDSPFHKAYDELLNRFSGEYREVNHRNIPDNAIRDFFGRACCLFTFENCQDFDFDGLKGRMLSSSYTPVPDSLEYNPMLEELRRLFSAFSQNGRVIFEYETRLFVGELA
jgi:SAM-dependent methyltransferase